MLCQAQTDAPVTLNVQSEPVANKCECRETEGPSEALKQAGFLKRLGDNSRIYLEIQGILSVSSALFTKVPLFHEARRHTTVSACCFVKLL